MDPAGDQHAWYEEDDGDTAAIRLVSTVRELEKQSAERRAWSAIFWRLSTGRQPHHTFHYAMSSDGSVQVSDVDFRPPALNALAAVIETLASGIGKNKPAILFSTNHADFDTRTKAKRATQWVWRLFNKLGVYEIGQACFDTSLRLGLAAVKVSFGDGGDDDLIVEYVHPDEIYVDRQEVALAPNAMPHTLHQRRFVDRERLIAVFPDKADEIRNAASASRGVLRRGSQTSRFVPVVEGWRLPFADQKGRHILAVGSTALVDEKWEHEFFPFAFLHNEDLPGEFYPPGIVEQGYSMQAQLDKLGDTIEKCFRLVGNPWVLVDERAEVQTSALGNEEGQIVRWNSTGGSSPPQVVTHSPIAQELLVERRNLVADIFKRFGVSDMLASGQKPAGVQAAEALRTLADQANMRQVRRGQRLEKFYADTAELILGLARERSPSIDLGGYGSKRWRDIDPGPKAEMRPCPLSSLPMEPAGIVARADEWLQRGLITQEIYETIVDFPDMERIEDDLRAARDNIEWLLDRMIEDYEYRAPEKYHNLETAIKMTQSRILREETLGTPDERLDLLRQFLDEAQALRDALTKPVASPPAPGGATAGPAALPAAPGPAPGVINPNQPFGA